jgi:transcriptional regulator of arginine metabolism
MKKEVRQKKILSLIGAKPIGTQQELQTLLERTGVPATQSSLSRDLLELGVVKHHGHYTVPRMETTPVHGLLSLDRAGDNLIVARTEPGLASAAAVRIDGAALPQIVGTLAGEDTIFIAVTDGKTQRVAMKKVWELFS